MISYATLRLPQRLRLFLCKRFYFYCGDRGGNYSTPLSLIWHYSILYKLTTMLRKFLFTLGFIYIFISLMFITYTAFYLVQPDVNTIDNISWVDLQKRLPRFYIVYSGSMEPKIKLASVVISLPLNNYLPGDIITFNQQGSKNTITHRALVKLFPDGLNKEAQFLTAGDANRSFDNFKVRQSDIIGKVVLILPYFGYVADFAKKPYGFILFVIVPGTIFVYEEIKFLVSQLKKSVAIIKKKYEATSSPNVGSLPKNAIIVPITGIAIFLVGLSAGYLSDVETSFGNVLSAAESFGPTPTPPTESTPTPTPGIAQVLVINEVLPDTSCFIGQKEAQWLEVYNGYTTTVNLKNFSITDGTNTIDLVTSNTNLPAGQFALIGHDNSTWTQCYDDNGVITANFGGVTFNVDTGLLQLLDPLDVIIDTVQWGTPPLNPTQDQAIERNPDGFDSASGANFTPTDFVVQTPPQPGL